MSWIVNYALATVDNSFAAMDFTGALERCDVVSTLQRNGTVFHISRERAVLDCRVVPTHKTIAGHTSDAKQTLTAR